MSDEDLIHLQEPHTEGGGFDVVLRGYDRRQVEDYIRRVDLTLSEADRLRQEDAARLAALEEQLATVRLALGEAERRAEGLPDPASLVGERLLAMLRLAEQEAEEIIHDAQEKALRSTADRAEALSRREAAVASTAEAADRTRMEAQRDAQALREKAGKEADELIRAASRQAEELLATAAEEAQRRLHTAEEDIAILHEDARGREAAIRAEAERYATQICDSAEKSVEELTQQREAIGAQLEDLRRRLAEAMRPLGAQE